MQEITAEILIERVWSYAEKIRSGEIKAGKKQKWAVERFFKDVDQLAEDDCPYYFDAEAVVDFYEWSRQFNHVEGIL
ncbi:terminase large subunit, partial [Bacillus velezensis]